MEKTSLHIGYFKKKKKRFLVKERGGLNLQRIKRETRLSKKMGRKEKVVVTTLKED